MEAGFEPKALPPGSASSDPSIETGETLAGSAVPEGALGPNIIDTFATAIRAGEVLEKRDVALFLKSERDLFLPFLDSAYGVRFRNSPVQRSEAVSFTTSKAVLELEDGSKVFLKRKPEYCSSMEHLSNSSAFQNYLSSCVPWVPRIVPTASGNSFAHLGQRIYFITPYIEGTLFSGATEESTACARVLAQMHRASLAWEAAPSGTPVDSQQVALYFVEGIGKVKFPDRVLRSTIQTAMAEHARRYAVPLSDSIRCAWTHGDFAPFNVVFRRNEVVAVNDFDNVAYGPLARDLAITLLTHCGIYYFGSTSGFNTPISTYIDHDRMVKMLEAYEEVLPLSVDERAALPRHMALHWLELMGLGLIRGDFALNDVGDVLSHVEAISAIRLGEPDVMRSKGAGGSERTMAHRFSRAQFFDKWHMALTNALPQYKDQIAAFFADQDKGFHHSWELYQRAVELGEAVETADRTSLQWEIVEQIAVFHDIGKFFQKLHSFENLSIGQSIYREYANHVEVATSIKDAVLSGIPATDFYNARLDPSGKPPDSLEADVARAADKMLDNIVRKVDRYWYEYGVPRNAVFLKPELTFEDRRQFTFRNFCGDQLNVLLTIIALRPEDFGHPLIQEQFRAWSKEPKEAAVARIIELAGEIGLPAEQVTMVRDIITQYRREFDC
ncbi:MAG: phosphotransferase [Deltaproteobacteria bacterium]|nr:phosphotransferase [Deltaproteobacteria bacterium]